MIYSIQYKAEAIEDLKEINEWYLSIGEQLSIQFQKSIKLAELNLRKSPFAYAQLSLKQFRRILLDNFPYKIIYTINNVDNVIIIFAVLHTSRSNKFLKRKLK